MPTYDLVLNNGRVIDPASETDHVTNMGISTGTIQAITNSPIEGREEIN